MQFLSCELAEGGLSTNEHWSSVSRGRPVSPTATPSPQSISDSHPTCACATPFRRLLDSYAAHRWLWSQTSAATASSSVQYRYTLLSCVTPLHPSPVSSIPGGKQKRAPPPPDNPQARFSFSLSHHQTCFMLVTSTDLINQFNYNTADANVIQVNIFKLKVHTHPNEKFSLPPLFTCD